MMMELREDQLSSLRAEFLHLNRSIMMIHVMNSVGFLENMGKIGGFNSSPQDLNIVMSVNCYLVNHKKFIE